MSNYANLFLKEWQFHECAQFSTNQITQEIGFPIKNLNIT